MAWLLAALLCVQDDKQEMEKLKRRLEELERKVGVQEGTPQDLPRAAQEKAKTDAGEVYSKPFLARFGRNVYLGGYMDLEYVNQEHSNDDTFDQHRFVPFIYADVSDHIKIAAEIEIEHGNGTDLGIEFAHIDYWIADGINFRAGIILDPLGHFNLVHDAPFQDLTLRPLVDETIIPAVLREPGVGFFGTFDLDPVKVDYEFYVVNGFKGLNDAGAKNIDTTGGLKNARPHLAAAGFGSRVRDFNDNKAVVGRVSISPFLGFEAGVSGHVGAYDEHGDNRLGIYAVDGTMNLGGTLRQLGITGDLWTAFEVVGEYAVADIGRNAEARAAGVPNDFHGYYVEPRFHFMPDFLRKIIPGAGDESTFTLTYRHDWVDLGGSIKRQSTVGLNFRPREDTVFKIEYQWREEHADLAEIDDDRFVASIATYF